MLEELKRDVFKKLSTTFQKWSETPDKLEEELHKKDAGVILCRKNGILELHIHAVDAKEAYNLLLDCLKSQFVEITYNTLIEKFPEIQKKIDEVSAVAMRQMQMDLDENNEESDDEDESPLVNPIIPRDLK